MASIRMRKVNKRFGRDQVLHDVDLEIGSGEFCAFVGPSGCGKSTLLRLVAGLEEISGGELYIDGDRVNDQPPAARGVAMVFQSYALYPHMTAYQNMAFGLKLAKTDAQSIDDRVQMAARMLQIGHLLERLPKQLSGGQRQRVAIGRAIVRQPKVFLFDEPLSNLDAALRVQTRIEIAKLHDRMHTTVIYVTHDQVEAMTLATKIVVLDNGYVEQVGAPMVLYHHPRNLFVAGFIGSPKMNFLRGELVRGNAKGALVKLKSGAQVGVAADAQAIPIGTEVTLGIRPEHAMLRNGDAAAVEGQVVYSEHLGEHSLVYLDIRGSEERLTVRVAPDMRAGNGDTLRVQLPEEACHLFNDNGLACRRLVGPGGVELP